MNSEAAIGGGGGGVGSSAPFYMVISLKRGVSAAQGRIAWPKPTN